MQDVVAAALSENASFPTLLSGTIGSISSKFEKKAVEALEALGADTDVVADAAQRAADAWWSLLDEREAEAALAA